jgi:hypothetical protein
MALSNDNEIPNDWPQTLLKLTGSSQLRDTTVQIPRSTIFFRRAQDTQDVNDVGMKDATDSSCLQEVVR